MKRERIREFCIEIFFNLKLGEKIMDENERVGELEADINCRE